MGGDSTGRRRGFLSTVSAQAMRRKARPCAGAACAGFAAAAMLLAAAGPAAAQLVPCDPLDPPNTCSVSTTNGTTHTSETLPGTTVVAPAQPVLTNQLQLALAGPNGAAIQAALANLGVLGPLSAATLIATQTHFETSVTQQLTTGPATILIGPDQSITFFVLPGTTNFNTNTHTQTFIHDIFQASRPLSNQGTNYLLGDLHTTFQTTLIDGSFQFMNVLLSRGGENGATNLMIPTPPALGFAPEAAGIEPFDSALAYATKAPRMPLTAVMANGWRAWIRGNYGRASFDSTDANFGFKYRSASGEGGIERVVGPWMYGAAFGFGQAKVTQDTTNDTGKLDTVRAGAYGAYRPGPWSVTAAATVGFSSIEALRLAALPIQARTNYDAAAYSAGVEAMRRIQTAHATYEPLAGLIYTGLRVDSFAEAGAQFLDLRGDRAQVDALKGYVGGRVHKTFVANGLAWTPEVRGRLLYDFLDDPRAYTARFVTDPVAIPLAVTGIEPDRFAVMLGGTLNARFSTAWRAFASYDAEIRGGDLAHLVGAGLKGNW
jgi:hypothetical protein